MKETLSEGNDFMQVPGENTRDLDKAALRGEPSYVWRAGQERRLRMILDAAEERIQGRVLDNGCGVGMYVQHLKPYAGDVIGVELDFDRLRDARRGSADVLSATSENLPFPEASFDVILSHEVLEHVSDDRAAVCEMVRTLRPGGRMIIFVPNRGYPFETHGIYWRGRYRFGNIPLVNYLPRGLRDRLAPHVRVYTVGDLKRLFALLPIKVIHRQVIFGAYDNIIARWSILGRPLRTLLQALEHTPLQVFGLSHFWVIERI
jgi:SAM-dependent methyltransferase